MREKLELIVNKMIDIRYGFVDNNRNIYPDDDKNWDKVELERPIVTSKNYIDLTDSIKLIDTK